MTGAKPQPKVVREGEGKEGRTCEREGDNGWKKRRKRKGGGTYDGRM